MHPPNGPRPSRPAAARRAGADDVERLCTGLQLEQLQALCTSFEALQGTDAFEQQARGGATLHPKP